MNPTLRQELTPRQLEFVAWVAAGLTNREVGERLGVTTDYTRYVMQKIFERSGTASRHELAVRYAWEELAVK